MLVYMKASRENQRFFLAETSQEKRVAKITCVCRRMWAPGSGEPLGPREGGGEKFHQDGHGRLGGWEGSSGWTLEGLAGRRCSSQSSVLRRPLPAPARTPGLLLRERSVHPVSRSLSDRNAPSWFYWRRKAPASDFPHGQSTQTCLSGRGCRKCAKNEKLSQKWEPERCLSR